MSPAKRPTPDRLIVHGGPIFNGTGLWDGYAALFEDGLLRTLQYGTPDIPGAKTLNLDGDILAPGFVDLQVNGGGGVMFGAALSASTLRTIAAAHRSLGATHILPTLITDTPDVTEAAIAATREALSDGVAGLLGLHLEGPHLSVLRKGAHDAALIRPMTPADLDLLLHAADALPLLKVTLAPENATLDQVAALAKAGALVSLGHSDADYATCLSYFEAGASCATHLFNAMSPLTSRAPGLVGAALDAGHVSAGVIADAVHVHPASLRTAWTAKRGPGALFAVSDAMAVAGSTESEFDLQGRRVLRQNGRLTLEDGTLAGADLDLVTAVRVLHTEARLSLADALAAATSIPARLTGQPVGHLASGTPLRDVIRIRAGLSRAEPLQAP
ncbi:N-acetylglucosamine-6-phosphate deacetylase [Pseudaestuariivita sp.]|uniref:N-acetylglucosamine-6-phosphate deacetylase n=1 Tax=Pseudaestuariivita sp. TaxID=2211669 RepID=UPI0040585755